MEQNLKAIKETILAIGEVQSGKTSWMIKQTREKLNDDYDVTFVIGGTNNKLLNQTKKRFLQAFNNNESNIKFVDINQTIRSTIPNKSIIMVMKQQNQLKKMLELINNSDEKKILILDDESDYGGINISKKHKEKSLIHSLIQEINSSFLNGTFVSVTATPFANLISDNYINYSKIVLLKTYEGYVGSNAFLKNNNYQEIKYNNDIRTGKEKAYKVWNKIIKEHILRVLKSKLNYSRMLINIYLKKSSHNNIKNNIDLIFENYQKISLNDIFPQENFSDYERENIKEIISELKQNIFVFNGNNELNNISKIKKHSIIIGGIMVSRGYTFVNLITTVMLNKPNEISSSDVLLQKARWFGNRKDYLNNIKVYMDKKTIEAYKECDDLIQILKTNYADIELLKNELIKKESECKNIKLTSK